MRRVAILSERQVLGREEAEKARNQRASLRVTAGVLWTAAEVAESAAGDCGGRGG